MNIRKAICLLPVLGVLSIPAMADHDHFRGDKYDRYDRQLDRQQRRIKQGVRSGELTRGEARKLRRQHYRIVNLKRHFLQNRHLDKYERRTLKLKIAKASDRIYRLKHNDRYRYRIQTTSNSHRDYYEHHRVNRWSFGFNFRDLL